MSDGNGDDDEIVPTKKFKKAQPVSMLNGEAGSSVQNLDGGRIFNRGHVMSNIQSPNTGTQIALQKNYVTHRTASIKKPIVKTLLHNENCLPSPWFSGRGEYLKKLMETVQQARETETEFYYVVISGLWGMGKSQVARKFIANTKENGDYAGNVFWIDASSGSQIINSFSRLADHFHINTKKLKLGQRRGQGQGQGSEQIEDVKKLVRDIYGHFHDHVEKGLFIFDGAKQFSSTPNELGVKIFLPNREKSTCHIPTIIITSRSQDWPEECKVLPLGPLSTSESDPKKDPESSELIKTALKISNESNYEPPSLPLLSNRLDGFPLVLAHVCTKISDIMKTAHGSDWNVNWPYNHGPENLLNTNLEDEIQKFIKQWDDQSPFTLLSPHELPDAPTHIFDHDSYRSNTPELWDTELKYLVHRANTNPSHKMALQLLKIISYLPQDSVSTKLLYFIINARILPVNSKSVQNLKWNSFNDLQYALGLLAKRSLITLDKSKGEKSYGLYQQVDPRQFLGDLELTDFFLGNNCGKIILAPLIQKLMRFSLKEAGSFEPLLQIVDFYLKNPKCCHQLFSDWAFFTHLKELNWPRHSYVAELYRILYVESALPSPSSTTEKLQQVYSRLSKGGRKTAQDSMYFKLCCISISFIGSRHQLTRVKNDDFSAILNSSKLFPRGSEFGCMTITNFLKSIVELMMSSQGNLLVWLCGAQIFLQLNSRKVVSVNDSALSGSNKKFDVSCLNYSVNDDSFGDKREQVINKNVWESFPFGLKRMATLINLYFKGRARKRKRQPIAEKNVELAQVMIKATAHLYDLPVFKKLLMSAQIFYVYLDDGEAECDEVKRRIWENFVKNIRKIPIWSSWLPGNTDLEHGIWNYNIGNCSRIKKYFMDLNGVKILVQVFGWFVTVLQKYQRPQNDLIQLMVSVFEILQELCFDSTPREQFLESNAFISSFSQLSSALMNMRFADGENVFEFQAIFSCAVSCLALSLPFSTPKKLSKKDSPSTIAKRKGELENHYQILHSLEEAFFSSHEKWTQDISYFSEKAKRTLYRIKEQSRCILEKVIQTRRPCENFQEDDIKTAQILLNLCIET